MRPATAAAAAVSTLIGAGAAAVAAGRYASTAALNVPPGLPLPDEPRLTVHATAAGQVALTRCLASQRPGTYGLSGPDVHAIVGPVLPDVPHSADTVVRRLESVRRGHLEVGSRVRLTPQLHTGTPAGALGLDYQDVEIPGELGTLPAWFVPATRLTWVITVHGIGTTREHPMNLMGFLNRMRLPVLDLAYRGDPGAPRPADGLGHLGASEWRDLDAAIRYAVRYGAERVILHGWSTGASMALYAAADAGLRDRISGLVLDSPVLDWEATLRALATARRVPAPLLPLAVRAAQGSTGVRGDRLAEAVDPYRLRVPTLLFHGPDDHLAPWQPSRALASRRGDLVTLHTVPNAPHAAMWNADPDRYEETLRRFLTSLI
ncbi:prolyl oligopeptidase family serine peptidase [Streptomyces ficellus]|uniref:Prolyl oligopeptidase family serine peptidase n=1 Tax=Streptomyces ficellus TaxID=1977088 RepID=A0ABT7Z6F4_9ACTN|nr:prolyl oligopeptidase family serine peptidase [Streptomyces ficellus]MDN3295065.1 prolyl oligopeptidase family serine peptidase [Streptomyces ficellus]